MEDRHQQIKEYLQRVEVQKRIKDDMLRARDEATVTISNAARLFGFSENQLRDWDEKGLLKPQRRPQDTEQDGKGARRRQYTPTELNKLAIIHELMEKGDFSIGTIPTHVDEMWDEVAGKSELQEHVESVGAEKVEHVHIDQRIERTEKEEFWHYFVSQALRLSLLLICEDVPDTVAGSGIILPLENSNVATIVHTPNDLPLVGYSLVGWLGQNRSFYAFLERKPSFEHPSDFRVEHFANLAEDVSAKQASLNNVLVIVQRKANKENPLILSKEVVEVVQRLLSFVYEKVDEWQPTFEHGVRNWMYQATDFTSSSSVSDEVLNSLMNIIVQLGGKMGDGKDRWRFSCILTSEDALLPVSKRTLFVRAQSKRAPHRLAAVSAEAPGLSFRAYQSGQIIYRSDVSSKDFMIAYQDREEFTHSAIAVPLAGEDGMAIGVVYIASEDREAFSKEDEQLLRFVGRIIEELLLTYRLRQLPAERLTDMIATPEVVDLSFKDFASESDFVDDIEALLKHIQAYGVTSELVGKELSIIAVEIDNLAGIAAKYGDIVARNLNRKVGERILGIPGLVTEFNKFYHLATDKFYIVLKEMSLDNARIKAELLKKYLERTMLPENLLVLHNTTVRFGVHTYNNEKLKELLDRPYTKSAVEAVSEIMARELDKVLDIGQQMGGGVIMSWSPITRGYIIWPPLS